MTLPLLMAARVQSSLDVLAALKARTPSEVRAEARLRESMTETLAPLVDRAVTGVRELGRRPSDEARARSLLGELGDVQRQLTEGLSREAGEEAARAVETTERKVSGARKQLPGGLDDMLGEVFAQLAAGLMSRATSRLVEALLSPAGEDEPEVSPDRLRVELDDMLAGEVREMSRHAVGDARNAAIEQTERTLGVRRHRWVTAGDGNVRPAHEAVHNEVVEIGEQFSNGWRRPGGVGCRCRLEPVTEE